MRDRLLDYFSTHRIEYRLVEHEPVTTSADSARVRGVSASLGAKALVVKADSAYALIVIPGSHRLDSKAFRAATRAKKLRFANDDEVAELVGLPKGAIPPVGELFGMPTYFDSAVAAQDEIWFNAGALTESACVSAADLVAATRASIGVYSTSPDE